MKTIFLAFLLVVSSGETFGQTDSALRVNMPVTAQASESIEPSLQRTRIDPVKEAGIGKLLKLQGITDGLNRVPSELLETIGPKIPEKLPPGKYRERLVNLFLSRLKKKMRSDEIINVTVSVYDRHFSQPEIDALISLYNNPLVTKANTIREQARVETESAAAKLMHQWSEEAMTEVLNENPDLRKEMEVAAERALKR